MLKRKSLKLASVITAVVLIVSCYIPVSAEAKSMANFTKTQTYSGQFTDVAASAWYFNEVSNAYAFGLAGGVGGGKFNPAGNVTIAEAITFAVRVKCIYDETDLTTITATDPAVWYSGYVQYAQDNGIIAADEFAGQYDRKATRGELAHILAYALPAAELAELNTSFAAVPDMKTDATYYQDVFLLYKAGVVTGSDQYGTFNPTSNITRAESVAIINRVADPTQRKSFTLLVGTVKLSQSTLALRPGGIGKLTATAANGIDNGGKILWKSGNTKVATVSADGVVAAVANGTANVWATESNGTKNSADCVVTVAEAKTMTSVDIFKTVSPAVFYIEMFDSDGEEYGSATGFFTTSDGIAYTNYHVIDGASSAKITMADGKTYTDIKVVGFDRLNDVAVLKVGGNSSFPYVTLGNSDSVQSGEKVYAIGNPEGLKNTISDGMISNTSVHPFKGTYKDEVYIQTSAPISSGSSGGVLVNEFAEVIGITALQKIDGQNLNFAVPINIAKALTLRTGETFEEHLDHLYGDIPGFEKNKVSATGANTSIGNEQPTNNGDTVTGALPDYNTNHYYSFTADAEGRLQVLLLSDKANTGNVVMVLVDDNDEMIEYDYLYGDFYISKPGTYHLAIAMVKDSGNTNVPYELYFEYTKNY